MAGETSNLSKMTHAQLVAGLNAALGNTQPGANFYIDELWRRESAGRERRMLDLTAKIEQLTWVVTAATIGALLIALAALLLD